MELDQFDDLMNAKPFEPFTVHVAEINSFYVPHPEFAWRTPAGGTIFVSNEKGTAASVIPLEHVTRLEPGRRANADGKPKSKSKGKKK